MAVTRNAQAHWEGPLLDGGKGTVSLESSGIGSFAVSWAARSAEPAGQTSPEELIGAAHSACYSMALSSGLAKAGFTDITLDTKAEVGFTPGVGITGSHLTVRGSVPGITAEQFAAIAEDAKLNCPVSKALTGTTITLDAALA